MSSPTLPQITSSVLSGSYSYLKREIRGKPDNIAGVPPLLQQKTGQTTVQKHTQNNKQRKH